MPSNMSGTSMRDRATASPADKKGGEKGLIDLLEHGLKDMYYAEKKIYRSLPKIIKAAHDEKLKSALEKHRDETEGHIEALEEAFKVLGRPVQAEKCDAIDGILEEGQSLLDDFGGTPAGDAAIIFSCQAVEHYEITRYGSMQTFAKALGHSEVAKLLAGVLEQEEAADSKLSMIAEKSVNAAAG